MVQLGVRVGAIILARMNSTRFPGKSVAKIGGIPMIEIISRRIKTWALLNDVTLIISIEELMADKQIVEIASENGIIVHNGDGATPKVRINEILESYQFDYFYRVNGDSPLIDVDLLDFGLMVLKKLVADSNPPDIVSTVLRRSFPYGISLELCSAEKFKADFRCDNLVHDEHVFEHIYKSPKKYRIQSIEIEGKDLGDKMFAVDTESDRVRIEKLVIPQNKGVTAINYDWKNSFGIFKSMFISKRESQ